MATQKEIDDLRKEEEALAAEDKKAKGNQSHSPSSLKAQKVLEDAIAKKKETYKTEGEDAVKAAKERAALPAKVSKAAIAAAQSILDNRPKNKALAELAKAETTLSDTRNKEYDDVMSEKKRQLAQGQYTELGRLMKEVKDSLPTDAQQKSKDESFLTAKTQGLGYNTGVGRNTEGRGVLIGGMGEGAASRKIYSDDPKDIAAHQQAKGKYQQSTAGGASTQRSRRSAELAAARTKLGGMQAEGFKRIEAQRAAGKDKDYNRLQARKGFAKKLHGLRFDPSKSTDDQRTAMYNEGEAMGLTPQQIDNYTQKYLRPVNAAQRVAGGNGQVVPQSSTRLGAGSLRIGSLRDPATAIAPKWTKMARSARRLRKGGYKNEAGKMALAGEAERLGTPNIRSDGFRAANAARQDQIRRAQEQDAAMKRRLIQQMSDSYANQGDRGGY